MGFDLKMSWGYLKIKGRNYGGTSFESEEIEHISGLLSLPNPGIFFFGTKNPGRPNLPNIINEKNN